METKEIDDYIEENQHTVEANRTDNGGGDSIEISLQGTVSLKATRKMRTDGQVTGNSSLP